MADTCSHDFDVIRWLSGSEVTKVYADGEILVYHKELDTLWNPRPCGGDTDPEGRGDGAH